MNNNNIRIFISNWNRATKTIDNGSISNGNETFFTRLLWLDIKDGALDITSLKKFNMIKPEKRNIAKFVLSLPETFHFNSNTCENITV